MDESTREPRESTERRRINAMADEAVKLAKTLDLKRSPNIHIFRVLDLERVDGRQRTGLLRSIQAELRRRGFKTPIEQREEDRQTLRNAREQMMLQDAYKHEARIDPRERDN